MINDKKLARISLAAAIAGIILIFLTSVLIGPQAVRIGDITEGFSGKHVTVNATVMSKRTTDGNIFLDLTDGTGNITAVMFERTARGTDAYGIREGDDISINGQINIYKDELEIIANSVIIWK